MRNLLPHIPRLRGVGLDEASVGLVFSESGRKDGGSGRDAAVSSFTVAEVNHALLIVSVKRGVLVLVVGVRIGPGGRRRGSSVPIVSVPSAECHHRFCGLGEPGIKHLLSHVEFGPSSF